MLNLLRHKSNVAKIIHPRNFFARTVVGSDTRREYTNRKTPTDVVNERIREARNKIDACKNPSYPERFVKKEPEDNAEGRSPWGSCRLPTGSEERVKSSAPRQCAALSSSSSTAGSPPPPPKSYVGLLMAIAAGAGIAGLAYYIYSNQDEQTNKIADTKKGHDKKIRKRVPATSKDIPNEVPYLLVGGGTASFAAFRAIKSNNPKAKVMVISNEIEMPYMRPPLSKELWLSGTDPGGLDSLKFKQWNGVERSLFYEPDDFYVDPTKLMEEPNGGVAIVKGYTIKHIDVVNRTATLTDGTEIKYEECLLATGSRPKNLDIFNLASTQIKERVSLFKTVEDFERLKATLDNIKSVAVIGGGFLGSELSCALAKYGESKKLQVHQIFHEKGNMGKVLPEYLSEWTTDRVREEGVNVIPDTQVKQVKAQDKQIRLQLNNGNEVLVDHVIVAVGSIPDVSLAKDSGLEVDHTHGGYVVNAELEARRHLYVAGDAACFYDTNLGRRRVEHHDHAVVSGRLAGENMVGLKKPYKHQSMFWSDLGPKVGYEAIGIVDANLQTVGVFAKAMPGDTPAAAAPQHLPESNEIKPLESSSSPTSAQSDNDPSSKFGKGVIFYLRNEKVVGIVLWNVFNRISVARSIINQGQKYDDLNEVAKLFEIHS